MNELVNSNLNQTQSKLNQKIKRLEANFGKDHAGGSERTSQNFTIKTLVLDEELYLEPSQTLATMEFVCENS